MSEGPLSCAQALAPHSLRPFWKICVGGTLHLAMHVKLRQKMIKDTPPSKVLSDLTRALAPSALFLICPSHRAKCVCSDLSGPSTF